jgi:hypothetical protein
MSAGRIVPPSTEAEGLPAYVRVGRDKRGGLVFWKDGAWRASNWAGPIAGAFRSRDLALAALKKAPSRPKPEKLPAAPKPDPSAYGLTAGSGKHVYDGSKRIGAVYLLAGQFAAWDASGKLIGRFDSAS